MSVRRSLPMVATKPFVELVDADRRLVVRYHHSGSDGEHCPKASSTSYCAEGHSVRNQLASDWSTGIASGLCPVADQ